MSDNDASAKIDAYIEKARDFAKPILVKVRKLFHKAFPDIEEAVRWGNPSFMHKGIVGGIAAFKEHVWISFWKGELMEDKQKLFTKQGETHMGNIRVNDVSELPADKVLIAYIKEAVDMNERGVKVPKLTGKSKKPPLKVPEDLQAKLNLNKNKKALEVFEGFNPSHKREYVEWITEAKREETRKRRIEQAIEMMSEGKPRNWKYMKKQ